MRKTKQLLDDLE